ncbi:YdcF family protein [Niallia nealsonii]|uniref:YdcF family protein n=1 Tax=Niallia nealsonii TaxID=115979 RepID=UPI0012FEB48B|nr:YdcF family protein [Niallia nealsonii]
MKKLFYLLIILAVACFGILAFYYIQIKKTAAITPPDNIPYIIVLGAKVNEQKLSKPLQYRAETAFAYWEKNQKSQIVVTGGQGSGETTTEAEALQNYFLEKGVPENHILLEDKSTSTYENIQLAKKLFSIEEAVIVSNDFHLFRAITIAKKEGIQAYPLAAKTPLWAKLPLYIREYAAIGKMKLKGY